MSFTGGQEMRISGKVKTMAMMMTFNGGTLVLHGAEKEATLPPHFAGLQENGDVKQSGMVLSCHGYESRVLVT